MKKKLIIIIPVAIVLCLLLVGGGIFLYKKSQKPAPVDEPSVVEEEDGQWSIDSLKKGRVTVIDCDLMYSAYIKDLETAQNELRLYGVEQREKYDNPKVKKIEEKLEKKYGIFAVNLGEMDVETAKDIEKAVKYVYKRYPIINGNLTNITLGNIDTFTTGNLALTQYGEYIINEELGKTPLVVKHEIILSASSFLNREQLQKSCDNGAATGHWPEGMNITTLVVHELGHQVLNSVAMEYYGFENPYYVTDDTMEAFSNYISDGLKDNQIVAKAVCEKAYNNWLTYHEGQTYEDFAKSISGYAIGLQSDGGISYSETVAEAVADIYLNKKKAADASLEIERILKTGL